MASAWLCRQVERRPFDSAGRAFAGGAHTLVAIGILFGCDTGIIRMVGAGLGLAARRIDFFHTPYKMHAASVQPRRVGK